MRLKRIQRKRIKGFKLPPNTICVNRPLKFGNPFKIVFEKNKWSGYSGWAVYEGEILRRGYYPWKKEAAEAAVEEFSEYIREWRYLNSPTDKLEELRGKNLACFCPLNQPCHADILLELANK